MSLLRFVARSMLASYFVINGVKALRHPEDFVADAQPLADKVLPLVTSALPAEARGYLPEDTAGFVKCNGALQIVGGLSLATGLGRRLGAGVLAAHDGSARAGGQPAEGQGRGADGRSARS